MEIEIKHSHVRFIYKYADSYKYYKYAKLNKWVLIKSVAKYFLHVASFICMGILFHGLGAETLKDLSPYI